MTGKNICEVLALPVFVSILRDLQAGLTASHGQVAEWLKAHAWNACMR